MGRPVAFVAEAYQVPQVIRSASGQRYNVVNLILPRSAGALAATPAVAVKNLLAYGFPLAPVRYAPMVSAH